MCVCMHVCVAVELAWHPESQQGRTATDVPALLQTNYHSKQVHACVWLHMRKCEQKTDSKSRYILCVSARACVCSSVNLVWACLHVPCAHINVPASGSGSS